MGSPAASPVLTAVLVCSGTDVPKALGSLVLSSLPRPSSTLTRFLSPSHTQVILSHALHWLFPHSGMFLPDMQMAPSFLLSGLYPNTMPSVSSFLTRESKTPLYFIPMLCFIWLQAT